MLKFEKLEKKLYDKTCDLPYFTADDIRKYKLMKYFDSPNQLGAFFKTLAGRGDISADCYVPATHKEAKGRLIRGWVWEVEF